MRAPADPQEFVPYFVLGIPAVVWGFSLIVALGGWNRLARDYATELAPTHYAYRWRNCRVGTSRYRKCVHYGIVDQGLFLSMCWLFRPGHRHLLIPWTDFVFLERNERLGMSRFSTGVSAPVKISIPTVVAKADGSRLPSS